MLILTEANAYSTSSWLCAYSPMIHNATLITRWERISVKLLQIFVKITDRCSGLISMTFLMKRIVVREAKVDLPSNFRKDFIRGLSTMGIVCGYVVVICLIESMSRTLYSLVIEAYEPCSSILQARAISLSKNAITSLMFLWLIRLVMSSSTFWLISSDTTDSSLMRPSISVM